MSHSDSQIDLLPAVGSDASQTKPRSIGAVVDEQVEVCCEPLRKRVPRGTYRNHAEAVRAYRERNRDRIRDHWRRWKYSRLKYAAKKRGIAFDLSEEDFLAIRSAGTCHYCRGPLPDFGHGIDRKDNSMGYTKDNVVACCQICNAVKCHQLSHTEMLEVGAAVGRIWRHRLEMAPS